MDNLSEIKSKEYRELIIAQEGELRDRYEEYRSGIENTLPIDRFEPYAVGQDDRGVTIYEERHVGTYKEPSYPMSFDSFIMKYDNEFTREYALSKNKKIEESQENKKEAKVLYEDLTPKEKSEMSEKEKLAMLKNQYDELPGGIPEYLERDAKGLPAKDRPKLYGELSQEEKLEMPVKEKLKLLKYQYDDLPGGVPENLEREAKGLPPKEIPKDYEDLTITEKSQMTVRQKKNMLMEQYPDYGPNKAQWDDAEKSPSITEVELLKRTVGNLRDKFFGKSESNENKPK